MRDYFVEGLSRSPAIRAKSTADYALPTHVEMSSWQLLNATFGASWIGLINQRTPAHRCAQALASGICLSA
jgi:hypothetical protein